MGGGPGMPPAGLDTSSAVMIGDDHDTGFQNGLPSPGVLGNDSDSGLLMETFSFTGGLAPGGTGDSSPVSPGASMDGMRPGTSAQGDRPGTVGGGMSRPSSVEGGL